MATSIASQLQALRSAFQIEPEQPRKRPITRPSVLYDPREAADIDIDTIFGVALSGLEVLVSVDERFGNYKSDLFGHKTKELDRELLKEDENKHINSTISSFLRLLSGHLQLPAAIKTLEYLIRRYKVHVYNVEDLILCALPYHDSHAFVRIIQLVDTGNSKWKFLDGVKASGAVLPRNVIVQQCIRDMGVLEAVCTYASPTKKFLPTRPVVSFATAVVIEVLGSLTTVGDDVVKRVLPFVVSGLQPGAKGSSDHKAGALMIVGLLANKVALSPKLVKSLIRSVAEVAREDAKESTDLQLLRLSVLALVNLIQLQSVSTFPKIALQVLTETRDITGVLLGLSKVFKIDRFLATLLVSLVDNCSDDACLQALISIIETVPVRNIVNKVASKTLSSCLKMSQKNISSATVQSGSWAKKVLMVIRKNYPSELHQAVNTFLQDEKFRSKSEDAAAFEMLCATLDKNLDLSGSSSDSKILFSLHHPKAEVRRSALSGLKTCANLKTLAESQRLVNIRDAVLSQLRDDDLTVVQAALSLEGLSEVINASEFLEAFRHLLRRHISPAGPNSSAETALACNVAISFLKIAISSFCDHTDCSEKLAAMMLPLLLILPKTEKLNLKVLELAKGVKWSLFSDLPLVPAKEMKLQQEAVSFNLKIIDSLADKFAMQPYEYMPCMSNSCKDFDISKTLLFLVVMQSIQRSRNYDIYFALFQACFPTLKTEWEALPFAVEVSVKEFDKESDCEKFAKQLSDGDLMSLNKRILIFIFWRLLEVFQKTVDTDIMLGSNQSQAIDMLQKMFVFFATSQSKHIFKEHRLFLVTKCTKSPIKFLSGFFMDEDVPVPVQVESLQCLAFLCEHNDNGEFLSELLGNSSSLLVPLACNIQDLRVAAMGCIEGLCNLLHRVDYLSKKNGNNANWSHFLAEFLDLIVQQKRLILSDKQFLPSFLTSLLGSSSGSLLVPRVVEQRFDRSTREKVVSSILGSALQLSSFGKLMIISLLRGLGNTLVHVKGVRALLSQLLERRSQYHFELDRSSMKLSRTEVKILCLLLEICVAPSSHEGHDSEEYLLKALRVDGLPLEESAVFEPCVAVLQKLTTGFFSDLTTEKQGLMFRELVYLFRNANGNIQHAARDSVLRINVTSSTVVQTLEFLVKQDSRATCSALTKKKKKETKKAVACETSRNDCREGKTVLFSLNCLLDILVLKKDIANRESLIGPLFELLGKLCVDECLLVPNGDKQALDGSSQSLYRTVCDIEQTLLSILEDIISSLRMALPLKDDIANKINIKMLVKCAHSAKDGVIRNSVFSLLSSIAKVVPDMLLDHILDIFTIIGESTVTQNDSYSQRVTEDLTSAIVPCWLDKTDDRDKLFQIFVDVLPEVAEHRRLSIVVHLLRTMGESNSLASLLVQLFRSLNLRKGPLWFDDARASDSVASSLHIEWEYTFAVDLCDQYSCMIWLPSLVMLLQLIKADNLSSKHFLEWLFAAEFILNRLQDPGFTFKLDSGEDSDTIQCRTLSFLGVKGDPCNVLGVNGLNPYPGKILQEIMVLLATLLQLIDSRKKQVNVPFRIIKELKERMHVVLRTSTMSMTPAAYFRSIINLLGHSDGNVQKKALGLLGETIREHETTNAWHRGRVEILENSNTDLSHKNDSLIEPLNEMCQSIVRLIEDTMEESDNSLTLSAVSALEVLAQHFSSNYSIFSSCLRSITKGITSQNLAVSCSCLRTAGALINVLGPRALAELPLVMDNVIRISREIAPPSSSKESVIQAILVTLGAVIDKLGGFLNPYLEDLIRLLVLGLDYNSGSNKLKAKANEIRSLLTEKIPVRLALPPLLKIYSDAVKSGDSSVTVVFEMMTSMVGMMDRSSIGGYHGRIFDLCLHGLDLRCQSPASIENIDSVEKSILDATISLSMKLTESMFRPLFIRSIEWTESFSEESSGKHFATSDRAISFYRLVNRLAESHRSLFVPYFKYLVDGCVRHLAGSIDTESAGLNRKKKKAKIQEARINVEEENSALCRKSWHLRALVISALHKCFLHDTGSVKFLESSNFQVLLKPIVSQLVMEPPPLLQEHPHIPSVEEVDELLVACISQMAVTAGSDLLWKPLIHEVLLQTRSEKIRTRILGLRIVMRLLENLKEEYLVFLPETIPFLGELMEDMELPVKSLAQDVLMKMETMSGEDLRQYLG
ncbi:hypothetical protein Tsubulata_007625 [Turnera subulata]|uniref:BP28 C-terminal domain-containing protein n=1 Tax=Turnera subulata TaxID=218843 RepID=A0A9Q0FZC2_9ROSI|nr:hypothetical protein Tsubulata_007625 [Turnera subulata]